MRLTLVHLIATVALAAANQRLLQHNPVHPSKTVDNCHSPMLFKGKYTLGRHSLGCGTHGMERPCACNEMDPFEFAYEMCEQGDGVCHEAIELAMLVQAQLDEEKAAYWEKAQQVCEDKAHCHHHKHEHPRFDPKRAEAAAKHAHRKSKHGHASI